jgi:Lamin Tail Domain
VTRAALAIAACATALAGCGDPGGGAADCRANLLPGDLVITEIFPDYAAPSGSSSADVGKEWFEIYNASSRPVDLAGVVVTLARPDGTSAKTHTMTEATLAPGAYFVLGDVDPMQVPPWVDYGYGADLGEMFNSNGGKLTLACGGVEVDHAVYGDVKSGLSQQLDGNVEPDYTANDEPGRWCAADKAGSTEFDPMNFGTPRAANQGCAGATEGTCSDAGAMRPPVAPEPGDLVITEVMPSPAGDDLKQEWLEVLATRDVDLNGIGVDRVGDTAKPNLITSPTCLHLAAGQYALLAKSSDATVNGGLPAVAGTFKLSLVPGTAAAPADVRVLYGDTVIDAVTWTKAATGKSRSLDPRFATADANDMERYWCDGVPAYGAGGAGTPGKVNDTCTILPPPGMCNEGAGTRPIVAPTAGQLTITEWMPDPTKVADTAGEWIEIQAKADVDLNGLQLGGAALVAQPVVVSADCVRLKSGGYALFAHGSTSDGNGGLPAVDGTFGFALTQGSGTAQVGVGGVVLDMVTWATSKSGASIQIDGTGKQCNAPAGTPAYNGTDLGTPKAAPTTACP